jgi:hypothetical protein
MGDLKEYQSNPANLELTKTAEKQTDPEKVQKPRKKTRQALKCTLGNGVKEKELITPFTEELVELESKIGFVEAVKQLEAKLPKFYGFSIQQWYEIYQNTSPESSLHQKALEMMKKLDFDARSLEEINILYSIAQPGSQLQKDMEERMSRIK